MRRIEAGAVQLSFPTAIALAKALGVTIAELAEEQG